MLFGTPDDLTARIKDLEKSGVDKIIFFISFGGIDHQKVLNSLNLFAKRLSPTSRGEPVGAQDERNTF